MPRIYEFRTQAPTIFDGQRIEANEVVAVLSTDQPLANVLSAATFGTLEVRECSKEQVSAAQNAIVSRVVTPPPKPVDVSSDPAAIVEDVDALNRADAEADAAEVANGTEMDTEPAIDSDPLPPGFEFLPNRIARALVRQGLDSKKAIREFLANGNDLVDLEEIGTAAVKKINVWLET